VKDWQRDALLAAIVGAVLAVAVVLLWLAFVT